MAESKRPGEVANRLLLALGYSERSITAAAKGDLATEADLSPSRFLVICERLGKGKSKVPADVWARMPLSTWQGTVVRGSYAPEPTFPPDEDAYEAEAAKEVARAAIFVCSADGAELFQVDRDGRWFLYQLVESEEPTELGSFDAWLEEGVRMARGPSEKG